MGVSQDIVDRIQSFSIQRQKAEEEYDRVPLSSALLQDYSRKLDETLEQLQRQVRLQEDELNKLRESRATDFSNTDADPWIRVAQARRATRAYKALLKAEDDLPPPGSPLPALLAVVQAARTVKEGKASLLITGQRLSADRQRLRAEESNIRDARLIAEGLAARIERIRNEQSRKEKKTPSQLAQELIAVRQERNEQLSQATEETKKSLDHFIDDTLAAMLAAEDLGGPNVGDASEVSDAVLTAGYTNHGRPKKPKDVERGDRDRSQQRIDELVRRQTGQERTDASTATSKREAAAAEMHALLDDLLKAGSSYIQLPRDSAASRFLVKAKVAQFHPRDASRIRLIDFGRQLDD